MLSKAPIVVEVFVDDIDMISGYLEGGFTNTRRFSYSSGITMFTSVRLDYSYHPGQCPLSNIHCLNPSPQKNVASQLHVLPDSNWLRRSLTLFSPEMSARPFLNISLHLSSQ
ncbi:hypothetical protein ACTXT7_000720 [Hymenolepis weldensis]